MKDFTIPADGTMTDIVRNARTFEQMRSGLRAHLGIESETDALYAKHPEPVAEPTREEVTSSLTARAASDTAFRIVYPHQNDRFEIWGSSQKDLDEKEQRIKSLYRR